MRPAVLITFFLLFSLHGYSQELQCNISVNSSQVTGTNKTVFEAMQRDLYEFMNTRIWTKHVYSSEERIECNILITIKQQISTTKFKGSLQVQSRRPVYKASYNTTMLNHLDENIEFDYVEFEKLEFSDNQYTSELSSLLAYYAYLIIGYDYDSYSPMGGTPYFEQAMRIVNLAQGYNMPGWRAFESGQKNRYWIVTNILDKNYESLRQVFYNYHRQGLDIMHTKINDGRAKISEGLYSLQKLYRKKPDPSMIYYKMFFTAKSDEISKIFSEAFPDEKARLYTLLVEIDSPNARNYQKLKGSR